MTPTSVAATTITTTTVAIKVLLDTLASFSAASLMVCRVSRASAADMEHAAAALANSGMYSWIRASTSGASSGGLVVM